MSNFLFFLKKIIQSHSLIQTMAIREIRTRYAGTLGGFFWSVVNPLMIIAVYWFVFSNFFRIQPTGNVPFIVVYLCGMLPWTLFSESLIFSTNSVAANANLVKKTLFPTEILPVVIFFASCITQVIMLVILLIILWFNNISFSIYNIQFLYYIFALFIFCTGLGWFCSAVNVFYRDTSQILGVVISIWFWLTPIVWFMEMVPQQYQFYLTLNPMYYIVDGYRASFVYHTPFWENPGLGIYFWALSFTLFIIGGLVFRRLKPDFPDVL